MLASGGQLPEEQHVSCASAKEEMPMRPDMGTIIKAAFATVLGILSVLLVGSTEAGAQAVDQPVAAYNPYPPGILPPDIQPELLRVRGEVHTIFNRYIAEWQALTPTP